MADLSRREERLMWKLVGTGSRRGASPPSRAGDVLRQPLLWAGFAAALSLTGPRGRGAALRGATCSAAASLIHLPIKRVVGRRAPPAGRGADGSRTGDLVVSVRSHRQRPVVMLGASQELPLLLIPLSVATLGSHWSLIRARKHYPSDVIGGSTIAITVTAAAWKLRPPQRSHGPDDTAP